MNTAVKYHNVQVRPGGKCREVCLSTSVQNHGTEGELPLYQYSSFFKAWKINA